jgi:hypothetical protein
MLTIRPEQMRVLVASSAYEHIPSLMRHAQQYHADNLHNLGSESLASFVTRAVTTATGYELYSERALARFLDIALVRGLPLPPHLDDILRQAEPALATERLEKAWRNLLFELEAES